MKTALLVSNGFEECEGLIVVDLLRRADISVDIVSIEEKIVKTAHNIEIKADKVLKEFEYDVIILPGGVKQAETFRNNLDVCNEIKKHYESGKLTCAICAAPSILGSIGILDNKEFTCYPGFETFSTNGIYTGQNVVKIDNIITAKGLGVSFEFGFKIIEEILGKAKVDDIKKQIHYNGN